MKTIIDVMADAKLFRSWFKWLRGDTWAAWKVFLKALFALPLESAELEIYRKHTGRTSPPTEPFTKAWLVCGRRSGKSRIAALIAVYLAVFRRYPQLQRGETGVVMIVASDRQQARVIFDYVANFFAEIPLLAKLVAASDQASIELTNGIRLEIHTSDYRSVRGFTVVAAVCDELAFWATDEHSASPDVEILNAIEKGSANIPGAMLLGVSSPYARQGALWEAYEKNFGKDTDELVWQADTRTMNPTISPRLIEKAYAKDAAAAAAEYGAEFRSDLADFLSPEAVAACVVANRDELAPVPTVSYVAFVDPSGGSSDAMTLAIAHYARADKEYAVLDLLREVWPPFSPEAVVREFCAVLKRYAVSNVGGDYYGARWVSEQFEKNGVSYTRSEKPKSDIYLSLLPAVNSRQVRLLDNPTLRFQLASLIRRTRSGGKDTVDHRAGGHDDVANAAAGALVFALAGCGDVYAYLDLLRGIAAGTLADPTVGSPVATARRQDVELRVARALCPVAPDAPTECPACVSSLIVPTGDGGWHCNQCRHEWFPGGAPAITVAGFVGGKAGTKRFQR